MNDDSVGNGFYNPAFLFVGELWPPGVEITGPGNDLLLREVGDFQDIEFRLGLGYLLFELALPLG